MITKNSYIIFVDTLNDKNSNPSNFRVKINDHMIRDKIKNNFEGKSDWYISIKTFVMLNSFSNISKDINDTINLYVNKTTTKTTFDINSYVSDFDKITITLKEGNPSVGEIQENLNKVLKQYDIECSYDAYDSRFLFKVIDITDPAAYKQVFINFQTSYRLLGFTENSIYELSFVISEFTSNNPINFLCDRVLKFSINTPSDFRIKNSNYCNSTSTLFNECNMFHLQPVNVLPYDLINYERSTDNLIPIELFKNSITDFEIKCRNQDNQEIEGLNNYIMVLEFVNIKNIDYTKKIMEILRHIYMWIASYLSNKI